jgi:hypothetical protein
MMPRAVVGKRKRRKGGKEKRRKGEKEERREEKKGGDGEQIYILEVIY